MSVPPGPLSDPSTTPPDPPGDHTLQQDIGAILPPAASGAPPGASEGRYRILRLHASGGLGVVYLAEDTELHRPVALKEIQPRHADDPRSRARFVKEAALTGRLAHPGVVPVHGFGTHPDGRPYYAMRFVEGETLNDAILRYHSSPLRLALRQLLRHFVDVCNAVAYAHSQGVIHRDLKPANILLGRFGETLLVDWGLAKDTTGGRQKAEGSEDAESIKITLPPPRSAADPQLPSTQTEAGALLGTPAYMAPEQAAGDWDRVGMAADVYSLGATLYTLLCGKPPLPDPVVTDAFVRLPDGGVLAPHVLAPETPPALEAICRRAMALKPADRYPSALALAADVEHWLADEPVSALAESPLARAGRWVRRHQSLVTGVTAAGLVATLSLAIGVGLLADANGQLRAANRIETNLRHLAEQNLSLAEVRYTQTRQAVDDFYTEVSDNPRLLRKEPGTQELRRALLERARGYYEQFLRERGDDPAVRLEAAAACFRLGSILHELEPGPPALELYERSRNLRDALMADRPDDPTLRKDLAASHNRIGSLLTELGRPREALPAFDQARTLQEQLTTDHPDQPRHAHELARTLNNIGVTRHGLGEADAALAAFTAARTHLERLTQEHPGEADFAQELGSTLGNLGTLLRLAGRTDEALSIFEQARAIQEQLTRDHPTDTVYTQDLAKTFNRQASAEAARDRPDAAQAAFERARELQERLVRENPGVAEWAQDLARTLNNLGTLLRDRGRIDEALVCSQQALAVREKLAHDHPAVHAYLGDLARSHNNIGILFGALGRRADALTSFDRAAEFQEKLLATIPPSQAPELAQELAKTHYNRGMLLNELGRRADARTAHERARAMREDLVRAHAAIPVFALDLAVSHAALADLTRADGRPEEALAGYDRALAIVTKLPDSPPTQSATRMVRLGRAETLSRLGRHADALAEWDQAITSADGLGRQALRLGRAASLVRANDVAQAIAEVETITATPNLPPPLWADTARVLALAAAKDAANIDKHAARALECLRRAAAAGHFRDPTPLEALKADADFAVVLARPDFQDWLRELSKPPGS